MTKKVTPLFVYGTLRSPVIRERLLGREVEDEPAVLFNYKLIEASHMFPYLDVKPCAEINVEGDIL